MANYMKQVAEMLGVELGEEFELEDASDGTVHEGVIFRLTKQGMEVYIGAPNTLWMCADNDLLSLLVGHVGVRILKKPWKPKNREKYWTYNEERFSIVESKWDGWSYEFALLKCGMVFRTEEEAIAARPRIYKELTGEEWEENGVR